MQVTHAMLGQEGGIHRMLCLSPAAALMSALLMQTCASGCGGGGAATACHSCCMPPGLTSDGSYTDAFQQVCLMAAVGSSRAAAIVTTGVVTNSSVSWGRMLASASKDKSLLAVAGGILLVQHKKPRTFPCFQGFAIQTSPNQAPNIMLSCNRNPWAGHRHRHTRQ